MCRCAPLRLPLLGVTTVRAGGLSATIVSLPLRAAGALLLGLLGLALLVREARARLRVVRR